MKTLSKLIREAADHSFWHQEVEQAALSAGLKDTSERQFVWMTISDMLDSIAVLAFDYRLNPGGFIPALKEWHTDQRTKLKVLADLAQRNSATPAQLLIGKLTFRMLGQIEFAFEQYELHSHTKGILQELCPPKLDPATSQSAKEISVHLRKAVNKLKQVQKSDLPTCFEFEIYRNILEAAARHFEEMGSTEEFCFEKAA